MSEAIWVPLLAGALPLLVGALILTAERRGWHRGRASAFRQMAAELERAAREGLPESDGARMARETAAQVLKRHAPCSASSPERSPAE